MDHPKPHPAGRIVRRAAALTLVGLLAASGAALADGGAGPGIYGPPPTPPMAGGPADADDPPRRDIHMGTVDHMRTGRDEEGNVLMEVRPRPKNPDQQPQVGPFYIYPQIGLPGQTGSQTATGQSTGGGSGYPGQGGATGSNPQGGPAGPGAATASPPGQRTPANPPGNTGQGVSNQPANGQQGRMPAGMAPGQTGQGGVTGNQSSRRPAGRPLIQGRRRCGPGPGTRARPAPEEGFQTLPRDARGHRRRVRHRRPGRPDRPAKETAMHPAALWKPLPDGRVSCRLCSHFCRIEDGRRGLCGVRQNAGGQLFTLVYDRVAAVNLDPVEKKPLYHFLPGTMTFSFGTMGCNLSCAFCQNYSLSQPPRQGREITGERATPADLVAAAKRSNAASISYTYSEPTIFFELMRDTSDLARAAGLKNIMVSNGFQSPACLDALAGRIDAANIDLKAMNETFYERVCGARLKPVLKNLARMRELGWWLEVTTLLIPGGNDADGELRELAAFLVRELGADTPWHISRFHPDFAMRDTPPTPLASLERAFAIGREAGLSHVYVGNVAGDAHNGTDCSDCGARLIDRTGFGVRSVRTVAGKCPDCGKPLAGRGLP